MSITKSAALVNHAEQAKPVRLTKSLESIAVLNERFMPGDRARHLRYSHWAQALNAANLHITVREEEISAAAGAYQEVAEHLAANLSWPPEAISIRTQGSVSTKTLIRSPMGGEKFDIDAVCEVDISRVQAANPMEFFESVGRALVELEAQAKRRCWNIPFPRQPFYLEFTPSVPLDNVPAQTLATMAPRYRASRYEGTALAVVDTPTRSWKTSNPVGMSQWVDDTSKRPLIRLMNKAYAMDEARASVSPVPDQTVEITDTLRVAIRLFKRHRDMCVKRNIIESSTKPISIIIVTLLTTCYEGLADLNRSFEHPVELLDELAALMPHLILKLDGKYRVDNPTVEGENFAEKWNDDGDERYRAFMTWCETLSADLKTILALTDPQAVSKRVREVFGIPATSGGGDGLPSIQIPAPKATPASSGLA
ncbi:nucleotidyltransferase [Pseudomonas aeruginosa]|uniref:nucleotidyltransferase domain-containing protein n=1 Tax=Pseudomonas aeruginosa TaxID=287 RepID=UPI0024AE94B3|nr:nucleotidyltransferase [Pseudomonas aeruginosa]MDI7134215.1 nucleotidyltransferase [Pseudomonas aeruginosa]